MVNFFVRPIGFGITFQIRWTKRESPRWHEGHEVGAKTFCPSTLPDSTAFESGAGHTRTVVLERPDRHCRCDKLPAQTRPQPCQARTLERLPARQAQSRGPGKGRDRQTGLGRFLDCRRRRFSVSRRRPPWRPPRRRSDRPNIPGSARPSWPHRAPHPPAPEGSPPPPWDPWRSPRQSRR